jgi:DNA repair photolyase
MNKTSGTKEWAAKNVNWCKGCIHNCRYCYAMKNALRFNRIEKREDWANFEVNKSVLTKTFRKTDKSFMMPSSHDIFPEILKESIIVLENVLKSGNNVLIVTKPHMECIATIIENLDKYKSQMEFRFTIGHFSNADLRFWEPGAPIFKERISCLKHANESGYKTSVSMEPLLTTEPMKIIEKVEKFCNEIWIGKMNHMLSELNDPLDEEKPYFGIIKLIDKNIDLITLDIIKECKNRGIYEKIRWKDSMKQTLNHLISTQRIEADHSIIAKSAFKKLDVWM